MSTCNGCCSGHAQTPTAGLLELSLLRIARLFENMARAIADHHAQVRAIRLLHSFSDRQLRDIGITRQEIERAVRGELRVGRRRDDAPESW